MTASGTSDERFSALADDFVNRQRLGQNPSIDDYAAAHPDLADEIRLAFPALLMIADLKPGPRDATGDFEAASVVVRGARLQRLGDFRLLREAGRGGMGVVYEAEQESLGRRVALKVLAAHAIADPAQVKRFEREARAAAQLHHTNIVPVFGVGEQDGLHYYAMQFIPGLGLDSVIEEVKRLRSAPSTSTPASAPVLEPRKSPLDIAPTVAGLARSLLSEHFDSTALAACTPGSIDVLRSEELGMMDHSPRAPIESAELSSDVVLGPSGLSSTSGSDTRYWRSVARVGLQVAQGLEYAHTQGIFHRDIKPSNLLLDAQGTAWLTDFGLAKAVEGDDLTHTGDIVGTIRYMAPERFQGRCDARSDVYALGLTLYEMVALRPAFDHASRQALIRQVMEETPPRLRKIVPGIPRDLETIIQMAIVREPGTRYATAGAMADDLALFLDGKPVHARDTGPIERCWKWARRRPLVAGLVTSLALAVCTGFGLVTWHWRAAVAARDEALRTLKMANQAVNTYFTKVSEEKLLNEPGMQPLRRELLKLSIPYYQAFVAQRSDDPALRADLAKAYTNWGKVTGDIGSTDDSRKLLKTAIGQFEPLLRVDPSNRDLQMSLARTYLYLAELSYRANDVKGGSEAVNRLAVLLTRVVSAPPDDPVARRMLGRCYDLAASFRVDEDPVEAKQLFEKALTILNDDVRDFPSYTEAWWQLAGTYANLAFLLGLCVHGDSDEADRPISRSIEILRKLRNDEPGRALFEKDLARALMVRGQICLSRGTLTDAGEAFDEGLLVIESVVARNPNVSECLHRLSMILSYVAEIRLEQGRTAIARKLLEKAIALEQDLFRRGGTMGQSAVNLIDCQSMLARLERESRRMDAAKKAISPPRPEMLAQIAASPDPSIMGIDLKVLLEEAFLDSHRAKDTSPQLGPLLEGLRKREDLLRKHPEDVNFRHQVVSGYLALGQMLAASGLTGDALKKLEIAASLLAPGLQQAPRNLRLQAQKTRLEVERAALLDQGGNSAQARSAAEHAVSLAEKLAAADPAYQYDLACASALQSRLDPPAPGHPNTALAALRKAIEAGFDNIYKLESDPYLTALHSLEEFRRLVKRLNDTKQPNLPENEDRPAAPTHPSKL